jgi:hypothetical protein
MKKMIATGLVLATVSAVPALAAPPKHRTTTDPNSMPHSQSMGQPNLARPSDEVVAPGDRVVGADPDLNIRMQILHDPVPQEY